MEQRSFSVNDILGSSNVNLDCSDGGADEFDELINVGDGPVSCSAFISEVVDG